MLPTLLLLQLISFIVCFILILPLIIYVNKKLYDNIKNEEHLEKGRVIQQITKHYSQLQFIGWPFVLVSFGLIKLLNCISPLTHSLTVQILVSTSRYGYTFFRDYLQFHSLVIAICRYTFIVWESTAEKFGITRLRRLFIGASIVVPLLTSTLYEVTCPIEKFYVSWFYGINNYISDIIESLFFMFIPIFGFRNAQKETIQNLLSEEAKTRRSKNFRSSLQLSVLTWSIEFVTGCLMAIDYSLGLSDGTFYNWMYVYPLIDIFLSGVVIPSAYILRSDSFRQFLYSFGWINVLRKLIGVKNSRVAPENEA